MKRFTTVMVLLACGCAPNPARSDIAQETCDAYERIADSGAANAQLEVAHCYIFGIGREKDFAKAEKWLILATENGSKTAPVSLASLILFKTADESRYDLALSNLDVAVRDSNSTAEFVLALAYRNGLGLPADSAASNKLLDLAANKNHLIAKFVVFGQIVIGERVLAGGMDLDYWRQDLYRSFESRGIGFASNFKKRIIDDELISKFVFSPIEIEGIVQQL